MYVSFIAIIRFDYLEMVGGPVQIRFDLINFFAMFCMVCGTKLQFQQQRHMLVDVWTAMEKHLIGEAPGRKLSIDGPPAQTHLSGQAAQNCLGGKAAQIYTSSKSA